MISGFATPEGTKNFMGMHDSIPEKNFNVFEELFLSNVGIGTYLGNPDSETDTTVTDAVKKSIMSGINVVDTAINYRAQKAERSVGKAIVDLIEEKKISRDQVFVSTKNGYVTNDGDIQEDFMQYVMREFGKTGIVKEGDISSGYHCMTIPYLEDQLNRSLKNLDLECIDLMYLHNAVEGHPELSKEEFLEKLTSVIEFYEEKRKEGKIRFYGMATWECFRVDENNNMFLSLEKVIDIAKKIGGENHGFRFIQLPYNFQFDQAYIKKNQSVQTEQVSILESARKLGVGVFTSVPLMQGKLLEWVKNSSAFTSFIPSIAALQFIRSTPGVLSPLIGQKNDAHVSENMEVMKILPFSENEFQDIIKKLMS